jgi:membrane-associated phospholipid phosphatase
MKGCRHSAGASSWVFPLAGVLLSLLPGCRQPIAPAVPRTDGSRLLDDRVSAPGAPNPAASLPDPPKPQPARWDKNFSHSNAWDYSLAAVGTTALGVELIGFNSVKPPLHWEDPILFDNAARSALHTPGAANQEVDVAWTLWGVQVAYPLLVDVTFAWTHHDVQLARDLFWQDAVTLTLAGGVDLAVRDLVGRARPETYDCLSQGGTHCLDSPEATRSFPGGHTANSTAASVLTCTQHLYIHLYGGPWDALTCALTVTSDLTLAALRIMSDNHWTSDQLSGLALGSLIGWGVPYFMHYRQHRATAGDGAPAEPTKASAIVVPMPITLDRGGGMGLTGFF